MEIVGGILVFVYYPKVEKIAIDSISLYNGTSANAILITQGWDTVQATVRRVILKERFVGSPPTFVNMPICIKTGF